MDHLGTILMTGFVTYDVKRFIVSKPDKFNYIPGQGVELVINQPKWKDEEGRPFTPTSLNDARVLEFTIKRYSDHGGVTDKLHSLEPGAELLISEPFGTISYKGEGVFIAAGAGLTPFLSIFREIARSGPLDGHRLLFSNKTSADIICERELRHYFGSDCIFTLTREKNPAYRHGRIDATLIKGMIDSLDQHFYVCGPEGFVEEINNILRDLGSRAELLVFEE
jgi:cytochrome-b5 reductase